MFRLCLLAVLFCLPLEGFGDNECSDEIEAADGPGRPFDGINNYRSYVYEGASAGECNNLQLTCEATIIPNSTLIGRTWFITNIRPYHGLFYEERVIQDYRIQCPRGTVLHLALQNSDLPSSAGLTDCTAVDFVRVNADGIDEQLFCGDNNEARLLASDLYNNGMGRIFPDGRATVSFCSNSANEGGDTMFFDGFVLRASCLNPLEFELDGCTDLAFTELWDPHFTAFIQDLPEPERIVLPHRKKRNSPSVSKKEAERVIRKSKRGKRFVSDVLELGSGDVIEYSDNVLTITFNDTTIPADTVPNVLCILAFTPLTSSRYFVEEAPLTFFGPGKLELYGSFAVLSYSIPPEQIENTFLPRPSTAQAANTIYDYIYKNWVAPYPVIDNVARGLPENALPIPLSPGNRPPDFSDLGIPGYRSVDSLGFVREDIQSNGGDCKRAIRIQDAPSVNARLPKELVEYCNFFARSCDLVLRTACREVNLLDPFSVGK